MGEQTVYEIPPRGMLWLRLAEINSIIEAEGGESAARPSSLLAERQEIALRLGLPDAAYA